MPPEPSNEGDSTEAVGGPPPPPPPPPPMPTQDAGARLGGYRLGAVLGQGGMGVVYRATHLKLARPAAMKLIAQQFAREAGFRERFERESLIAASIDHPNVIPVYDAGEDGGHLFIVMRLVEGRDLREMVALDGALEPRRAASLVEQIGAALDAAHGSGLVHRDVKPANVLVEPAANGGERAYLTDFGLTKMVSSESGMTESGALVGTVDYIAPEQARGESVDARTDVYALGAVLFQVLTGEVPFPRESSVAKILAHVNDPPPLASERGDRSLKAFDPVIQRAMAKEPNDRFASAGDLGRAAVAAAEGRELPRSGRVVAKGDAAPRGSGPRRWLLLAAGALAILLVAAIVMVALQSGSDSDAPQPPDSIASTAAPDQSGPNGTLGIASVGDIEAGDSEDRVHDAFGEPDETKPIEFGPGEDWIWHLNDGDFTITFDGKGRMESYTTNSSLLPTEQGTRVGDRFSSLCQTLGVSLTPVSFGASGVTTKEAGVWQVTSGSGGGAQSLAFSIAAGRVNEIFGGDVQGVGVSGGSTPANCSEEETDLCGTVGVTPNSDNAIGFVEVSGVSCDEAQSILFDWGESGYPGDGPSGFTCEDAGRAPNPAEGNSTGSRCTRGDMTITFGGGGYD